jgi:hypothetical protein
MTKLYPPRLYPHLQLEENRRELERERALCRRLKPARTPILSGLGRALRRSAAKPRHEEGEMQGVIVEFEYGDEFEPERIAAIARDARRHFEALPGLRQKAFTVDKANRRAVNVYLWDSEERARGFFTDELVERVGRLYGLRPRVSFVDVAGFVDNASAGVPREGLEQRAA